MDDQHAGALALNRVVPKQVSGQIRAAVLIRTASLRISAEADKIVNNLPDQQGKN
jgi:hypothetical protein